MMNNEFLNVVGAAVGSEYYYQWRALDVAIEVLRPAYKVALASAGELGNQKGVVKALAKAGSEVSKISKQVRHHLEPRFDLHIDVGLVIATAFFWVVFSEVSVEEEQPCYIHPYSDFTYSFLAFATFYKFCDVVSTFEDDLYNPEFAFGFGSVCSVGKFMDELAQ